MSRLDELIADLCPDGVEYKSLEEVLIIRNGSDYKGFQEGNIPVYGSGGIMTYVDHYAYDKPTVLIPRKGSIDKLYYVDTPFWNVDTIFYTEIDTDKAIPRYVYHCLMKEHLEQYNTAGGVPSLTQKVLNKVKIPLPPIELQREIVRILDNYTELTAELTKERTARKKQYDYYLNYLLDLKILKPERIMYVGDLFEIKNGLNKEKEAFGQGTPIVNFTDVYNNRYLTAEMLRGRVTLSDAEIARYEVKKGDVFFTRTSETKEDVGMSSTVIEEIPNCTFSGFVLRARPLTNLLLPKFCSYYFSTKQVRDNIVRYASFTTRATTSGPKLSKIPIPVIPIKEQERIIYILDRFDILCNNISEGLPAEIEARKKQYEYYRDKLLTFKEKA